MLEELDDVLGGEWQWSPDGFARTYQDRGNLFSTRYEIAVEPMLKQVRGDLVYLFAVLEWFDGEYRKRESWYERDVNSIINLLITYQLPMRGAA